jgi:hypothetical protein
VAERFFPDPDKFYRTLTDAEIFARRSEIDPVDRQTILDTVDEVRKMSRSAKDEDLLEWNRLMEDCWNEAQSLASREYAKALIDCLRQIKEEMKPSEPPETATVDTEEAEHRPSPEEPQRGFWRRLFGG